MSLFNHMERYTSIAHDHQKGLNLAPSHYLDVHVTHDQQALLNPKTKDVLLGSLMLETSGIRATKKMAKRRLDISTGLVQSYCRVLNGPENVKKMQEHCQLASSLAAVQAEKDADKAESQAKKNAEGDKRAANKAAAEQKQQEENDKLMPGLKEDVAKGLAHVMTLHKTRLSNLLRYFFEDKTKSLTQMKKAEVMALAKQHMEAIEGNTNTTGTSSE
jgi:hypothetical protein